jgi:CPA1 family monovalent cation:H+ antiporter
MALVLGLPAGFPQRNTLVVLAFSVVLFSLLAQGLTVGGLLKRLGLAPGRSEAAEYRRLASEMLACQAALREVERLRVLGVISRVVQERLAQEYQARLKALEEQTEALHLSDEALTQQQLNEARRLTLLAEKSALIDAERNGLLEEEDYRALVEQIDARLLDALSEKTERGSHPSHAADGTAAPDDAGPRSA